MAECSVCLEKEKVFACPTCDYKCCCSCTRRYLLDTHLDPHCMNCRRAWDSRLLVQLGLPKSFLTGDWARHRREVLFERERSRFPATIAVIEEQDRRQEIMDKVQELEARKKEIVATIAELKVRLSPRPMSAGGGGGYQRPCPMADCSGYLSSAGLCALCKAEVCLDCNVNKKSDEPHHCKQEDLDNWKLISSTTKPCPSCGARIFKNGGCAQVWCTQPHCHTAFNWNTGKIETGQIHNPHYYEWLFSQGDAGGHGRGREAPRNACNDGLVAEWSLNVFLKKEVPDQADARKWMNFHRELRHVHVVELQRLIQDATLDNTQDLRIKYLKKEMDDAKFMQLLHSREKKRHREVEVHRILQMFYDVGSDLMRGLVNKSMSIEEAVNTRNGLIEYHNACFKNLSEDFQCLMPYIDSEISFHRYYQRRPKRAYSAAMQTTEAT